MKKIHWWWLGLSFILTACLRMAVVNHGNFPFWFDPGRDAVVSREILEKHDLKIQGPTASGTQDTVYHGVLYFYLIGPLYTWFGGDPQQVISALAILSAVTVLAVYGLARDISGDKNVGILAAFLYAFSYDGMRGGTWLSNPMIASVSLPFFFWLLWRVMFLGKAKEWPWLTLAMAISTQSVIYFGYQWLLVGAVAWWRYSQVGKKFLTGWSAKKIWLGLVIYGLGISSMLLAQLKAWRDGIFTVAKLAEFASATSGEGINALTGTLILYANKTIQSLLPTFPVGAVLLLIVLLIFVWRQAQLVKVFWLVVFSSPLWLLAWHFRNMNQSMIGLEAMSCVVLAGWLKPVSQFKVGGKTLAGLLFLIFIFSQSQIMRTERLKRTSVYFVPQGAYFHDQLAAIDYSYQIAAGQPFSLSTLTNPYGYNTLWSYLYSWYGQQKYGYQPQWFGPDQTGIFGGDLLARTASPSAIHVSLYEPTEGIPDHLIQQFSLDQNREAGTVSATQKFGTLRVEVR